jgi:hypothetical protein
MKYLFLLGPLLIGCGQVGTQAPVFQAAPGLEDLDLNLKSNSQWELVISSVSQLMFNCGTIDSSTPQSLAVSIDRYYVMVKSNDRYFFERKEK